MELNKAMLIQDDAYPHWYRTSKDYFDLLFAEAMIYFHDVCKVVVTTETVIVSYTSPSLAGRPIMFKDMVNVDGHGAAKADGEIRYMVELENFKQLIKVHYGT